MPENLPKEVLACGGLIVHEKEDYSNHLQQGFGTNVALVTLWSVIERLVWKRSEWMDGPHGGLSLNWPSTLFTCGLYLHWARMTSARASCRSGPGRRGTVVRVLTAGVSSLRTAAGGSLWGTVIVPRAGRSSATGGSRLAASTTGKTRTESR